jgi:hypothetical protein
LLNATTYGDVGNALVPFLTTLMQSRPDVFKDLSGNPAAWPVDNTMEYSGLGSGRPRIVMTKAGEAEDNLGGDTENTHTLYPFNMLIEDREAMTADSRGDVYTAVRKCLMDAFRDRVLFIGSGVPPGTPTCQTKVKPRAVFNKGEAQYQYVRSHFLLLVWVNEQRVQP